MNTINPPDKESEADVDSGTTNKYTKDGSQVDSNILDQNLEKENEVGDVVKTVYKIHQVEICEKITVQGQYPQKILIQRKSSDTSHISSPDPTSTDEEERNGEVESQTNRGSCSEVNSG